MTDKTEQHMEQIKEAAGQESLLTDSSARGVDYLMEAVQCFASEWSLLGGRFDHGQMLEQAEATKARIRGMLIADALAMQAAEQAIASQRQVIAGPDRDSVLEEAAQICDDKHHSWRWDNEPDSNSGPRDCAQGIRALKSAAPVAPHQESAA